MRDTSRALHCVIWPVIVFLNSLFQQPQKKKKKKKKKS